MKEKHMFQDTSKLEIRPLNVKDLSLRLLRSLVIFRIWNLRYFEENKKVIRNISIILKNNISI